LTRIREVVTSFTLLTVSLLFRYYMVRENLYQWDLREESGVVECLEKGLDLDEVL